MAWTVKQEGALGAVQDWFRFEKNKPFYLAGYAGTGKTTLAKHFAQGIDGDVCFAAFTGKAASVLRKYGCPGATTIHSLIYRPAGDSKKKEMLELETFIDEEQRKETPDEKKIKEWSTQLTKVKKKSKAMFDLREGEDAPGIKGAALVIIDECSMIDERIQQDLESFGVPILVLGDPGQLPPVGGKGAWTKKTPDYLLTEIHRQARDSSILRFAHMVREGKWPGFGEMDDNCAIFPRKDFDLDLALEADQVICGRNKTRNRLNAAMRTRLGFRKLYPLENDKLICLKNDHFENILNGVTCTAFADSEIHGNTLLAKINYEGEIKDFYIDPGHFEENYRRKTSFPAYDIVKHFDYGYAITGHKSQGSQWPFVLICDDRMQSQDREMRRKWLYTVITRAEKRLVLYT